MHEGTDPRFVGLQVDENHPLYEFWLSIDRLIVEPFREGNNVEGVYKFVTFRTPDGQLLQLGKRLDTYSIYLETLNLQSVIDDEAIYDDVLFARFINTDGVILFHSDRTLIGQTASEGHVFRAIEGERDLAIEHSTMWKGSSPSVWFARFFIKGLWWVCYILGMTQAMRL